MQSMVDPYQGAFSQLEPNTEPDCDVVGIQQMNSSFSLLEEKEAYCPSCSAWLPAAGLQVVSEGSSSPREGNVGFADGLLHCPAQLEVQGGRWGLNQPPSLYLQRGFCI